MLSPNKRIEIVRSVHVDADTIICNIRTRTRKLRISLLDICIRTCVIFFFTICIWVIKCDYYMLYINR